ncbi:MAG: MBL fold metallo-hydrolase [archaeon]
MKISFLGGAREVGRSCILLEGDNKKILLDCGVKLSRKEDEFPILEEKVDYILITHAHLDHCGYLPHYLKKHNCKIICTKPTRDLAHILLADYAKVSKSLGKESFSNEDLAKVLKNISYVEYWKKIFLKEGISVCFHKAGHMLGSASIMIELENKRFFYTGDISFRNSYLLEKGEDDLDSFNYLVMECTYGNKNLPSLKNASNELIKTIKETLQRKGKVLIPAFGVGRSQEIMLILDNYVRSKALPSLNAYCDGLIKKANRIYRQNVIYLKQEIINRILLGREDFFEKSIFKIPRTKDRSDALSGDIIIATSGMLTGGPALYYFEKIAEDERNCLILVGYQAEGTLGRELLEGKKEVFLPNGKQINFNAQVKQISFSAHADQAQLLNFLSKIKKPEKIFLVHGDEGNMLAFKKKIEHKFNVETPRFGESFTL